MLEDRRLREFFFKNFRGNFANVREFSQVFASFLKGFGLALTCWDLLGSARMHSDASGCVRMRSDTLGKIRKFLMKKSFFWYFRLGWPPRAPLAGSWERPDVLIRISRGAGVIAIS